MAVFVDGQAVSVTTLAPPAQNAPPNLQVEVTFSAARRPTTLAIAVNSTVPEGGCQFCASVLYFACQSDEFLMTLKEVQKNDLLKY